jgi:hypothetical protein
MTLFSQYVMVIGVRATGGQMSGVAGPFGCVKLSSVGAVGQGINNGHAQEITKHVHTTLGIEPNRWAVV